MADGSDRFDLEKYSFEKYQQNILSDENVSSALSLSMF